ncbi:hypothetical protein BCR44DRAFT_372964 [Catenaria anguillulae PL171]|uniref:Uncharacterized protein n=1 Tax=Catenaria anguillulae PL171 TaxID=765915 RepID=A0A1Y2HUL6_9FUNG|nr:hypothetical protein BCR44DRAFT_372964 [Catenaria anguillulae PL171]
MYRSRVSNEQECEQGKIPRVVCIRDWRHSKRADSSSHRPCLTCHFAVGNAWTLRMPAVIATVIAATCCNGIHWRPGAALLHARTSATTPDEQYKLYRPRQRLPCIGNSRDQNGHV